MLVLSRKINEAIQIGDDIEIKVISISGDQVKLGIEAPNNIDIHRKEIYLSIQHENNAAAQSKVDILKSLSSLLKK
ncbi:carbon storage regulator CsrA [Bacillus sp. FJAT-45066]|uniref:carbon storage regulator CsrA n=1 Tax=Bacillus sp. FJAT-45066 TaxID=2011010 RepID=UPI000BB8BEB9|nr:carbon storage regulator CsrA [Bacillus sp. FJAT-45066]